MDVTPDTEVYLVRFDVTKEHQLTFDNILSQEAFFQTLALSQGVKIQPSSYQRQDYKIRFPAWLDEIENYNYCFFKNPSYSNKWYYCYITDMEYKNDGLTDVTIKIDVFQTYQFDFIYKNSYVEREHVNDDTRGKHTIPENIETGEYVINSSEDIPELREKMYFVKVNKDTSGTVQKGTTFGSLYSGCGYYACRTYLAMTGLLQAYEDADITDAIESVYVVPYAFFNRTMQDIIEKVPNNNSRYIHIFDISKATSLDGYTPINKKLLTGEYCYLMASNQSGGVYNYNYEDFKTHSCQFSVSAVPVQGCSGILTPLSYGTSTGTEENFFPFSLQFGKLAITDYNFDNYAIWLRQNMLNISLAQFGTITQAGLGVGEILAGYGIKNLDLALTGASNVGSAFTRASDLVHLNIEKSKLPVTTVGQISNGDIMTAMNTTNFYFYKMSIKKEYAKLIDNYFSRYGYKVLESKVPNIEGRENWNYVKTVEAIVESDTVPEKYLNEYKQMLNSGITFWHDYSTFMDYSKSNTIV